MTDKFEFREKGHQYLLNGKKLTGVTTIIGIADFGKGSSLIQWSANQAVDYIKDNALEFNGMVEKKNGEIVRKQDEYVVSGETLENARKAWVKTRDKAGDIGTVVHKMVEEYVKSRIKKTNFNLIKTRDNFILQEGITFSQEELDKVEPMFEQFIEWEKQDEITFLLSEQQLYSKEHWYAGTVDLVFLKEGKIYLGDLKTAANVYLSNMTQMGGYEIMLSELRKIPNCAGYCVINIPKLINKEGKAFRRIKYDTKTQSHKQAFMDCLSLYRYKGNYDKEYGTTRATKTGIKKVVKI
jgi:hypothetical protein